jgi:hypothetical protein
MRGVRYASAVLFIAFRDRGSRIRARRRRAATIGRMTRIRLDQLLTDRGLARSRAEAQALIHAGDVISTGPTASLARGQLVAADVSLSLVEPRWATGPAEARARARRVRVLDPTGMAA